MNIVNSSKTKINQIKLYFFCLCTFLSTTLFAQEKVRIIAETDLGGDADDQATLVRFLLYANELDIEGIILSRSPADFQQDPVAENPSDATTAYGMAMDYLDAYGAVLDNLRVHAAGYPSMNKLKNITFSGHDGTDGGVQHIIRVLKRDDPRPLWYTNWGCNDSSTSSLKRALDKIEQGKVKGLTYDEAISKLRYVEVYKQNHIGNHHRSNLTFYMDTFWPEMDGGRWYHQWDMLTGIEYWLRENATTKLCNNYYTTEKEGDTPTWMHLLPNGLNIPGHPDWGSWSGRFGWNEDFEGWWADRRDTWQGTTSRNNTLARWGGGDRAQHIRNDFKTRAKWCEIAEYENANHPPEPKLNGKADPYRPVFIKANPGETVDLSASGSSDPDGDQLNYQWEIYTEAGNVKENVTMEEKDLPLSRIDIPANFQKGDSLHVVLRVTDHGNPPLTRYQRAIIIGR